MEAAAVEAVEAAEAAEAAEAVEAVEAAVAAAVEAVVHAKRLLRMALASVTALGIVMRIGWKVPTLTLSATSQRIARRGLKSTPLFCKRPADLTSLERTGVAAWPSNVPLLATVHAIMCILTRISIRRSVIGMAAITVCSLPLAARPTWTAAIAKTPKAHMRKLGLR